MYKFRSMYVDAPLVGAEYLSPAEQKKLVTPWGRFMRKMSWDELPQLFNILKGEMSFIGPRPGLTADKEPELVAARLSFVPSAFEVRPGMGGYAQYRLKRSPDIRLKAEYDSYYVQHLSFWLDVKVFFFSFLTLFGYNTGR